MTAAKVTQPVHVEKKVIAAVFGSALASAGVYVLQHDSDIVSHLHGVPAALVAILAGPLLTGLLAYKAKHSLRDDLAELGTEVAGQIGLDPDPLPATTFPGTLADDGPDTSTGTAA